MGSLGVSARTVRTTILAIGLSTLTALAGVTTVAPDESSRPNPKLAKPLKRWPSELDLKRLESVKGLRAADVLKTLGHPSRVERQKDGHERWIYPWLAIASVSLHNGVATDTFYTAGF